MMDISFRRDPKNCFLSVYYFIETDNQRNSMCFYKSNHIILICFFMLFHHLCKFHL